MKVSELIELLGYFDADAEVVITTQPNYPMEHAVAGAAMRANLPEAQDLDRETFRAAPSDVILVEGNWLRYGLPSAWDAARRPPERERPERPGCRTTSRARSRRARRT
jgi:hypothetical protein